MNQKNLEQNHLSPTPGQALLPLYHTWTLPCTQRFLLQKSFNIFIRNLLGSWRIQCFCTNPAEHRGQRNVAWETIVEPPPASSHHISAVTDPSHPYSPEWRWKDTLQHSVRLQETTFQRAFLQRDQRSSEVFHRPVALARLPQTYSKDDVKHGAQWTLEKGPPFPKVILEIH